MDTNSRAKWRATNSPPRNEMALLIFQILVTVVATLIVLVIGTIGVKKADPLMLLGAVFLAIPTVGLGTGVCLRALAALIA
ncbi:TPA: hypothetical protein QDC44_001924 [Burkholderia cepacia ATCC 25416]|nr:hypothetical protein [Burkholderia cepacia ATCC 25416]